MKSILIILFSALFFATTSQAITKRTANECLICHILWFSAFKTEKKTLVGKKDSAIVITGSMGLASSRKMCFTCHDGYVVESRMNLVKDNPHFALKKPPDDLKMPESFRLDSNNEIYCGTCHTLHDITGTGEVGNTAFMRMDNQRSQMCIACHGDKTRPQGTAHHRTFKQGNHFSRHGAGQKGSEPTSVKAINCRLCHRAHGENSMVSRFKLPLFFHRFDSIDPTP